MASPLLLHQDCIELTGPPVSLMGEIKIIRDFQIHAEPQRYMEQWNSAMAVGGGWGKGFRAVAGCPRGETDWGCGVLTNGVFGFGCDCNHLPSIIAFLVNAPRLSVLEHLYDFLRKLNLVAWVSYLWQLEESFAEQRGKCMLTFVL